MMKALMVVLMLMALVGCSDHHWEGFVYFDKTAPEKFKKTKVYGNYENCRSAAWTMLLEANAVGTGYVECGMDCTESLVSKNGYHCKEIVRNR